MKFQNRFEAGSKLAEKLRGKYDLVAAIPRGGVVVGKAVAEKLKLPLGVVVTKKIGAPGQEELAVGAMDAEGEISWDEELMQRLGLSEEDAAEQIKSAKLKIKSYGDRFKSKDLDLKGKRVVVVDDGVATGETMRAAVSYVRRKGVGQVTVAVPVCSVEAEVELKRMADEVVCLSVPEYFGAVGQFYDEFPQVTDDQVADILRV